MDELHQQTVSLLSFQSLPRAIYDAQAAYNLLGGMGEEATVSLAAMWKRAYAANTRRSPAAAARRWPCRSSTRLSSTGTPSRLPWNWNGRWRLWLLKKRLTGEHIELVLEDTDSPSNLAATGQNEVLVRLRPEPLGRNSNQASRLWLWAAADNLRLNAQNAVQCALDLRRLRPQGTVQ